MPLITLPEVRRSRTYFVDPSVQINKPVTDHNGKIVAQIGARVNPLEHLPGFRPIAIIDGEKERQVEWLKRLAIKHKPTILITGGDALELGKLIEFPVYPVPEKLLERFSIQRVPVILSQEGKKIKVQEVVP